MTSSTLGAVYSTCIFCNRSLGTNSTLASFPVGRRVAFDAAKGRLWVICRRCERWNLTPLDERWEAVEEAERLYHDTRRRVATSGLDSRPHLQRLLRCACASLLPGRARCVRRRAIPVDHDAQVHRAEPCRSGTVDSGLQHGPLNKLPKKSAYA